jgi:DNA-binding MarR family transcriptional regulator
MAITERIRKSIRKLKADTMSHFNLKSSHAYCLYYLYKNSRVTLKKLCELSCEDKATVSRTVDFLRGEGYIKEADAGRYKTYVTLTEKGKAAGEYIAKKIDRILDAVAENVTEDERLVMYTALEKISLVLLTITEE